MVLEIRRNMFQLSEVFCGCCGEVLPSFMERDGSVSVKYYPGCPGKEDGCKKRQKQEEEEGEWRSQRGDPPKGYDLLLWDLEFWERRVGYYLTGLENEPWLWSTTIRAHVHRETGEAVSYAEWDPIDNPENLVPIPDGVVPQFTPAYVHKPPKVFPGQLLFKRTESKL
jgi:hypothetical protein